MMVDPGSVCVTCLVTCCSPLVGSFVVGVSFIIQHKLLNGRSKLVRTCNQAQENTRTAANEKHQAQEHRRRTAADEKHQAQEGQPQMRNIRFKKDSRRWETSGSRKTAADEKHQAREKQPQMRNIRLKKTQEGQPQMRNLGSRLKCVRQTLQTSASH